MNPVTRWRWSRLARARDAAGRHCAELCESLRTPLPDPRTPVHDAPLLAVDLEMTGLTPGSDAIVSIGWVPIDAGAIDLSAACELRVSSDGGRDVGHSATIHGIRDCDRHGGVMLGDALQRLVEALSGRIAVFHHAPLDTAFLDRALSDRFGVGWLWPAIDTLAWFRRRQRERDPDATEGPAHLAAVRAGFGLPPRAAHRAVDDAISCAEVVLVLAARSRARLGNAGRLPLRR